MEFYLVRLSYTADAWQQLIASPTSLDERLAPVRRLIKELGGSLPTFHFFDTPHSKSTKTPPLCVPEKMATFGKHDLLTMIVFPTKEAAFAFNMAISAEPGLKTVDLMSIIPLEDAIAAMPLASRAVKAANYAAPGRKPPGSRAGGRRA
jgi:uncharacterized protein with GYD domain